MLTRLIYASQAVRMMTSDDIGSILHSSRMFNARENITGMLCHGNDRFIQYLEGRREEINLLYGRIMRDERHRDLILLDYGTITQRLFENWSMGYVSTGDALVMAVVKAATGADEFRPEDIDSRQAVTLINGLKQSVHPQFVVEPDMKADRNRSVH